MKHILIAIVCLFASFAAFCQDSLTVFYRIRLDQDIDKSSERLVSIGLEKALKAESDYVILDLDTYGGAVDAADSIRSAILGCPVPVIAYINMQAASAGAFPCPVQLHDERHFRPFCRRRIFNVRKNPISIFNSIHKNLSQFSFVYCITVGKYFQAFERVSQDFPLFPNFHY